MDNNSPSADKLDQKADPSASTANPSHDTAMLRIIARYGLREQTLRSMLIDSARPAEDVVCINVALDDQLHALRDGHV